MPIGETEGLSSPSPLDLLMRLLSVGNSMGASPTDAWLNQNGSIMGSARANPRKAAEAQGPLMATFTQMLNRLGPSPLDALGGGGGALAHVPGTYRRIGLQRTNGPLNPAEYLSELLTQANYPRFKQLSQSMVRRSPELGESFPVFRGKEQLDPLMKALTQGTEQLPISAFSTKPDIAEYFARVAAETSRKPAMIATGRATPEAVVGLLPRRNSMAKHEGEILLDPNLMPRPQAVAKMDMAQGLPFYTRPRTPQGGGESIEDIIGAMNQSVNVNPTDEIMRALAEASKTPY